MCCDGVAKPGALGSRTKARPAGLCAQDAQEDPFKAGKTESRKLHSKTLSLVIQALEITPLDPGPALGGWVHTKKRFSTFHPSAEKRIRHATSKTDLACATCCNHG